MSGYVAGWLEEEAARRAAEEAARQRAAAWAQAYEAIVGVLRSLAALAGVSGVAAVAWLLHGRAGNEDAAARGWRRRPSVQRLRRMNTSYPEPAPDGSGE